MPIHCFQITPAMDSSISPPKLKRKIRTVVPIVGLLVSSKKTKNSKKKMLVKDVVTFAKQFFIPLKTITRKTHSAIRYYRDTIHPLDIMSSPKVMRQPSKGRRPLFFLKHCNFVITFGFAFAIFDRYLLMEDIVQSISQISENCIISESFPILQLL